MSKEKNAPVEGLETAEAVVETTEAKVKKVQTPEEKEVLEAGVAKIKEIGVSENFAKVLALVADWNGEKETLSAVKEEVIKAFGGSSDALKDYIDGDFQKEIVAFQGIAKALPVLNNIKAFYARRANAGTGKVKLIQISISGTVYNVNQAYAAEISSLPAAERKELLLAHADTKELAVADEII